MDLNGDDGSISACLGRLKQGDREVAQLLWSRYFVQLVGLARSRLRGTATSSADEEDVALSAFDSFYRRAEAGGFPKLDDRNDLWQILFVITARKAIDQVARETRKSRGGGMVRNLSDLADFDAGQILGKIPTPELAAQFDEECRRWLERLPTSELRRIALWKMEGFSNAEIAAKLGCVIPTVERKLKWIRSVWRVDEEGTPTP
ncbi:MAG: ECF-type sigma factor [Isosphaeraceae bacterium]